MRSLIVAAALFTFTSASQAAGTLITFDDINGASTTGPIADGYKGLSWKNFGYVNPITSGGPWPNSGAANGIVSLFFDAISTVAGAPAQIQSPTPFTFNSAYFAANWNDGLEVTVKGELEGIITQTKTFTVNTAGSSLEVFDWQNIDTVLITATGGVRHQGLGGNGMTFAMDNLIINSPVPEPETYVMLLAGLGLLGWRFRNARS